MSLICSLAARREPEVIATLSAIASGSEIPSARAALEALGRIGGAPAGTALLSIGPRLSPALKTSYAEAVLSCAASLVSASEAQKALPLLEMLNQPDDAAEAYFKIPYVYAKEKTWTIKAYLRIGKIYENKEDWDKAIAAYKKVVDMSVAESKFATERTLWIQNRRNKKSPEAM